MHTSFEKCSLWQRTLASTEQDGASRARERLRTAFLSLREKAAALCNDISSHLPEYTVHDLTHADALWDVADLIAGDTFPLTPTDAFVFGAAALLHDAAMSLGAYPRGLTDFAQYPIWPDLVSQAYLHHEGRLPTATELATPIEPMLGDAIRQLLRRVHAERASQLPNLTWGSGHDNSIARLIDDVEIRLAFGRMIGLVAYSHWWSVAQMERDMPAPLGAPHWCPAEWTVDPIKIAGLLRVADAAHIDARRAPHFQRAVRSLGPEAERHWLFQGRLQRPQISDDALVFTSGSPFTLAEAPAWWLCLDTLRIVDGELRQVDALFADRRLPRLKARRVSSIEAPQRLVSYVPTDGWVPVDTTLHVSDVPGLVERLGGRDLYGTRLDVAVRELVQNGADAVRARRHIERRPDGWGRIVVKLGRDDAGEYLEIGDCGIGMSRRVLSDCLLDFGQSYWKSNIMLEEHPGLLASGFQPTGRYGIGFFAVFMLGRRVRVITRPCQSAVADTVVLEFGDGPSERPILRAASASEVLLDGGSSIRVWLSQPSDSESGLLASQRGRLSTLVELCSTLAPALDVAVDCEQATNVRAIDADDWLTLDPAALLARTLVYSRSVTDADENDHSGNDSKDEDTEAQPETVANRDETMIREAASRLRELRDENGRVLGRACIAPLPYYIASSGAVTVGGLHAMRMHGISGLLSGVSLRASRDEAEPLVPVPILRRWATEQGILVSRSNATQEEKCEAAGVVWRCGGELGHLPICRRDNEWFHRASLIEWISPREDFLLVESFDMLRYEDLDGFHLEPHVLIVEPNDSSILLYREWKGAHGWPIVRNDINERDLVMNSLAGAVIDAAATAWNCTVDDVVRASRLRMTFGRLTCWIHDQPIYEGSRRLRKPSPKSLSR